MADLQKTNFEKRQLGKSKVAVTSVGFGTVPLAGFKKKATYAEFEAVIKAAYDGGVRYFDCAPMYGFGKAEYYLGLALRELGIRNDVVVSTKVGRVLKAASRVKKLDTVYGIDWVDPLPFLDTYDYTYDGIMRSFEDSQARLSLDYMDVLLVHDLGKAWHGEQADVYWEQIRRSGYKALDELRSTGAVSAVGLGVNETDAVLTVAREFEIDCSLIAGRYTLLNQGPLDGAFKELQDRNVSVIAGGVFNSGILATGLNGSGATYDYQSVPEAIVKKVQAIQAVCDKYRVPLASAAIEFVLKHPAVATVVLGAPGVEEQKQNLASASNPIPAEFWQELKEQGLIPENAPTNS
ncbi:aldo/keto reductase [Agrobacterium tumefaciens]|uniref:aldo/keto reductase n=1 Tax=Agrobacterium tumefaciens TaxID=358 RepID=UPI0012B7C9A2|nr:aldo/keto reductase [Agrobacterium tumefaciens]MQB08020.1 aldo/keto reductase [Agrobacterium tumefaciens]